MDLSHQCIIRMLAPIDSTARQCPVAFPWIARRDARKEDPAIRDRYGVGRQSGSLSFGHEGTVAPPHSGRTRATVLMAPSQRPLQSSPERPQDRFLAYSYVDTVRRCASYKWAPEDPYDWEAFHA